MLSFSVQTISYKEIAIINNKEEVKKYENAISIADEKIRYTNVDTLKRKEEIQVNRKISYLYVFFFFHSLKYECRSPPNYMNNKFEIHKLGGN